ncbi:mediator of RNA polymerase II transcription subunit 22 isoform X1 [Drosophila navojoa]|nr:mediator of RNA polymerase II transcription subunit 22 isoform X1 [Drosophila navojoa]
MPSRIPFPLDAQAPRIAQRWCSSCKHNCLANSSGAMAFEILKLARRESHIQISKITQCEQDALEMQVRAANMVRAGESLMKLVADLKQYLILNDFHSVNEAITNNSQLFRGKQIECDKKLMKLRDEMAMDLYDLEEEYYTSIFK